MSAHAPLLLSLAAAHVAALLSPGPNWVVVAHAAVHQSRRHALATALGVATAALVWSGSVAFGVSVLFALHPWLHVGLRLAGAGYLIHLGVRMWRGAAGASPVAPDPSPGDPLPRPAGLRRAYVRGVVTNLTNPKSLAYFGSVFTLFTVPGTPTPVLVASVAIVSVGAATFYGGLGLALSTAAARRLLGRARATVDRLVGAVMIALGARLLLPPG